MNANSQSLLGQQQINWEFFLMRKKKTKVI